MENIRCVIADISQIMLADIIQKIIEIHPEFEVVDRIDGTKDLSHVLKHHAVDVVMLGAEAVSVSQSLSDLLYASPQTVAVGVIEDGRRVCVCIEDPGPAELLDLIQTAAQNREKRRGLVQ